MRLFLKQDLGVLHVGVNMELVCEVMIVTECKPVRAISPLVEVQPTCWSAEFIVLSDCCLG